jgi:hypothetical protein
MMNAGTQLYKSKPNTDISHNDRIFCEESFCGQQSAQLHCFALLEVLIFWGPVFDADIIFWEIQQ